MADHGELTSRLAAALDRIGAGVAAVGQSGGASQADEVKGLNEALEAERNANAQLEERVLAIKEKQEKVVARLEEEVEVLSLKRSDLEAELAELRREFEEQKQGAGGNSEMAEELRKLREMRSRERAELDDIIVELSPLF